MVIALQKNQSIRYLLIELTIVNMLLDSLKKGSSHLYQCKAPYILENLEKLVISHGEHNEIDEFG